MTTNSQLPTTEPKKNQKQTRTVTESQKWRSHGGLSTGEWDGDRGGKGTDNKQHKWQVENRQEKVENGIGNREVKELICTTRGHELRRVMLDGERVQGRGGIKGREKWDNCNSIISKIHLK